MIKGLDVSAYQVNVPWKDLVEKANLGFAIIKGDQLTSTDNHMSLARAAGVPIVGEYYWIDPTSAANYLVNWYANDIREHKPDFVWLDVEQYWADWGEYFDAINGKIPWTAVRHLTPKAISDHAKAVAEGLKAIFPELRIGIYSATWFTGSHSPPMLEWIGDYPLWWAHYYDGGTGRRTMSWEDLNNTPPQPFKVWMPTDKFNWTIWQYSSTIMSPSQNANYDWNAFDGTLEKMKAWVFNKIETEVPTTTMPSIYKEDVPLTTRGNFIIISSSDKQVDLDGVSSGTDAVMMKMCSQATNSMLVAKDAAFPIWVDRATKPVIGLVEMDQNLFWNKEITLPVFQSRNMWTNETFRSIIEQWRSVPISQNEWDAKSLNINANSGWHKLNGLVLMMSTTVAKASAINGLWQSAIINDILKPLNTLMEGGYIPTIPIYLMASWNWYSFYAADQGWNPKQWLANKQLAGLGVMRPWGQNFTGLITDSAPMATPADKLSDVWQYCPSNDFKYPFNVDGINYSFFVYSYNRLRARDMFYAGTPDSNVSPVTCGLWYDTVEVMAKELGSKVVVIPPQIEPPVVPVNEYKAKVLEWETWYANAPKKLG